MSGEQQNQWPIERLLGALSELQAAFGADSAGVLASVRADLEAAIAERDAGAREAAVLRLATAMTQLAELGERLGSAEGALMRSLAGAFVAGLAREDRGTVEEALARIQGQAGKPRREPS